MNLSIIFIHGIIEYYKNILSLISSSFHPVVILKFPHSFDTFSSEFLAEFHLKRGRY